MHAFRRWFAAATLPVFMAIFVVPPAFAQVPIPWAMGMQAAHSPVKAAIIDLHNLVFWIITVIVIFVAGLMLFTLYRFHHTRHPNPTRTSHNTVLEIGWTVIPVLILVIMAIPSFRLVYFEDRAPDADMTLKVTGHQWYWEYTYPDQANLDFGSYILPQDQLQPGQLRLLDVDSPLVLPAGKTIRILTTSADVIHSFFIPSLGVQRYAIPGRTIETWVKIDQPGHYYGECNQICGTNHDSMPISIQAMSQPDFEAWVVDAKKKFASNGGNAGPALAATAARHDAAPVSASASDAPISVAQVQH